jgi:hypothetical protein
MFHRFSTWWRALSVVLLSLAAVTWPAAAHAETTPTFTLQHQSAVTRLSPKGYSRFSVTFAINAPASSKPLAQISLYPRIIERSELPAIYSGTGAGSAATSTTGNFDLDCVSHDKVTITVSMFTRSPASNPSHCTSRPARLHLACASGLCDGVYPLSYSVTVDGATTTKWSLLAVQATSVARPLHVDIVDTLDPTTLDGSGAIPSLKAIAEHPTFPLTLTADYRTLGTIEAATSGPAATLKTVLNEALASPLHRVIAAPPADIDFAGLVRHGLPSQVSQQLSLSNQVLQAVTGRYVDGTVLLSGSPTLAAVKTLVKAHVSDIIVPDDSLSPTPSTTLNWGAPFHFTGVTSITALSSDAPLEQLATNTAIEPGRRVAMTLATLAFLHFEAPDAPSTRTVVMLLPVAKTSAKYLNGLLNGFLGNPFAVATSLTPSFNSSLVATNGAPATRTLANTNSSTWSPRNVSSLRTLIGQVNSFNGALTQSAVADALSVAVARAEVIGDPSVRQSAIDAASAALSAQLGKFSVDQSSITLTGPGTVIPITLLSRANYPVTAVVHLITDRLSFPRGNSVTVHLDSTTKSVRIPTANHRGSDLTLQVIVTSPNGQLVIARTAIQVRIAGNSVVGYLLTLASLLVLGFWWIRTYRRKAKGRHAR